MEIGISIYLSNNLNENIKILKKANDSNIKFVFTSLNIPEESVEQKQSIKNIISLCREYKLKLIIDINKTSKELINFNDDNIYLRIDDGISLEEIKNMSLMYNIVLNASTITKEDLETLKGLHANFNNIYSLHNFYPKRFTGISKKQLLKKNLMFKEYNIKTMAFTKGDVKRGPCFEYLVTVEEHRNIDFLEASLDLFSLNTDIVIVADIDLSDENYKRFKYLSLGIVPLRNNDDILTDVIFSDRLDSSEYVVRNAVENRKEFLEYINSLKLKPIKNRYIKKGDILISNSLYKRYEGELEVAIKDLGDDPKRCIYSYVIFQDLGCLKYIHLFKKFIFITKSTF